MIQSLRQTKSKRGVRRTTAAARGFVPDNLRIAHRPEDIERRLVPGHWVRIPMIVTTDSGDRDRSYVKE